ncbi:hypothetical protein DSM106972_062180 [Dulcicalothrix desertica PCC 7102]|uniref:Uncharacterized protein n=1 Tax=Dulcicalothrix desertica PCC 7102 TaxID=232991 RepID=A0A433V7Q2_9CYAN|nr:type IV toxin-antitoxin system AbiEi family antitoxin [Dulcicalothrix desertica]RUT02143.1 hypothetical protein DSM106972_062180 [Dulcicalothrix desertica PCC 7102]TWH53788.1 transcriptional regulator with AbiEi antitoxin domain of type IV toxin-antitoxin system [Dulcicalothrix desertica PCC 7102]
MKAYEFPAQVNAEGKIELPDTLLHQLQQNQQLKVIIVVNEPSQDEVSNEAWLSLAAESIKGDQDDAAYTSQITPTVLKVIYILLKTPEILTFPLLELANTTGVALETLKKILENLYKLGYLYRQPRGGYRIANYIKLFERWEIGYVESLRPKLLLETFTYTEETKFSEAAMKIIELANKKNFLIGGELGASLAIPYLVPQRATLHVVDNYDSIIDKLKLKPSPRGEISFLKQFDNFNHGSYNQDLYIADPLLIHAELMIDSNDRLEETAKRIFTKYIISRQQDE